MRGEFRQRPDGAGTLWTNEQGAGAIASAARQAGVNIPTGGFSGVAMSVESAQKTINMLREKAGEYRHGARLNEMADLLDEAIADARANGQSRITIVDSTAGEALSDVKSTTREERFHRWQDQQGIMLGPEARALHTVLRDDPTYTFIREKLIEEGYPADNEGLLISEAAAKVASGQWEAYKLESERQGLDFLHRYYSTAARMLGPEVLAQDAPGTAAAKRTMQDVRELTGAKQAGGANTAKQPRTRADVEGSPEFKRWFGDSKVVDEQGKPLVVYHGTQRNFDQFIHGQRLANPYLWDDNGLGFFFSNSPGAQSDMGPWYGASGFAGTRQVEGETVAPAGAQVLPVYLALKNPKTYSYGDFTDAVEQAKSGAVLQQTLKQQGYDGVIRLDPRGRPSDYIAFESTQIKSATGNRGTFDPNNPSILANIRRGNQNKGASDVGTTGRLADGRNQGIQGGRRTRQASQEERSIAAPSVAGRLSGGR